MNKTKKFLIFLIPIFIISMGVLTFFAVSMIIKNNNQQTISSHVNNHNDFDSGYIDNPDNDSNNFYDGIKYFPELDSSEFYSYIRMNEKTGTPIINKETIQYIINYIVKNMPQISGDVSVGYKQDDPSSVKIQVKFVPDNSPKEYYRTYLFKAINSI